MLTFEIWHTERKLWAESSSECIFKCRLTMSPRKPRSSDKTQYLVRELDTLVSTVKVIGAAPDLTLVVRAHGIGFFFAIFSYIIISILSCFWIKTFKFFQTHIGHYVKNWLSVLRFGATPCGITATIQQYCVATTQNCSTIFSQPTPESRIHTPPFQSYCNLCIW